MNAPHQIECSKQQCRIKPRTFLLLWPVIASLVAFGCGSPGPVDTAPDVIKGYCLYPVLKSAGGSGDIVAVLPDGRTTVESELKDPNLTTRDDPNVRLPAIDTSSISTVGAFLNFVGAPVAVGGASKDNVSAGINSHVDVSLSATADKAAELLGDNLKAATQVALGRLTRIAGARYYVTREVIWAHNVKFTFSKGNLAGLSLDIVKSAHINLDAKTETSTHVTYPVDDTATSYKLLYIPQDIPEDWWPKAQPDPLAGQKQACMKHVQTLLNVAEGGFDSIATLGGPAKSGQTLLRGPLDMEPGILDRSRADVAVWTSRSKPYADTKKAQAEFAVLADCVRAVARKPELVEDVTVAEIGNAPARRRVRALVLTSHRAPTVFMEASVYSPSEAEGMQGATMELEITVAPSFDAEKN